MSRIEERNYRETLKALREERQTHSEGKSVRWREDGIAGGTERGRIVGIQMAGERGGGEREREREDKENK